MTEKEDRDLRIEALLMQPCSGSEFQAVMRAFYDGLKILPEPQRTTAELTALGLITCLVDDIAAAREKYLELKRKRSAAA